MNLLIVTAIISVAFALSWGGREIVARVTRGEFSRIVKDIPLTAAFGIMVIMVYFVVALAAPLLAPYGETSVVGPQFLPWNAEHLLGTDSLGRDTLSRLVYGARNTVGLALATTLLAFLIGTILGLISATAGYTLDRLLSLVVDIVMAIPALILSLVLLSIFGTSVPMLILIIAVVDSTRVYRLTRSVAMNVVVMDYIEAAKLRGEGMGRLIFREILPNITAPLVAEFGLRFCFVFLTISALSFLGLGVQPPTADWGSMVREFASLIAFGDVTPLLPAGAIALLTVAVNFVVDWMLHRSSGLKD
ncbi:ABC transporter permease [Ponticoccus sp. (in: a-proteobacteria)]|uniref:ABC transporter permease n=1 Tax=Ponticoccus sp. (in: a-proteobacteria) TaxID=1925025 RepID=UPI003AB7BD03